MFRWAAVYLSSAPPEELRAGIYWLSERLYSSEATRRRRKEFFSQFNPHMHS